ncbi:methanol/ethanol family PQQ-dependent dehydrogenase [Hyphomicrobium sp. CS1GBMeth3]|uniref:methanol/ethanol family PQQ-dependent dehydrogenase n=1 Tax=Hyphomicrobium sp. CS1GBMeth3 TaxID=1892845 RepID=UPI000AA52C80|nr:methanol/ethanol family PQQ-dependent dehydrogenase [Hyphomicrobium sp. CS1GBMeth3]
MQRVPLFSLLTLFITCTVAPALAQEIAAQETARLNSPTTGEGMKVKPRAPDFATTGPEWHAPGLNPALTRFSALDQINAKNVANLQVVSTFSTGLNKGHEAAPIVVGTTLYFVTPYPNVLYALDITKPGMPLKWKFEPKPEAASQGVACCDVVNRGASYSDGRIYFNTLDGQTLAVDAESGKEVWRTKLGDITVGETITMAPLVAKDKVIVGNSGGEMGVRGWATALDAATGKIVWKAYSTGPDSEVLIGPDYKPFYDKEKGKDLGVTTWPADMWKQGGGTVWGWVSFDPELNLIYYGTSNPGPWNSTMRPGDNKWTAGIFARDVDTGQARWFYQLSPHDVSDYDGVNENILLDIDWKGQQRKVLVHPDRNGHVYVIDRTNGEVLSAEKFHAVNSSHGVDLETGQLLYNEEKRPQTNKKITDICPAPPGAKDWQPAAFSHSTGLLYLPHNNLCMDLVETEVGYIAGTPYVGADVWMKPGPGGHRGEFSAWDIASGKEVWAIKEKFPVWSGAVATAGDVVFYGTMEGWFKAVDAKSGKELWKFKTGSGIIGQPTTWAGPAGKQFVAILSGVGGWAGAIVSGELDGRDGTAALGFANAMRDLPDYTAAGGMLYVFALP